VSIAAITLCVASQLVFIVVNTHFVTDSVRKFLDTSSYILIYPTAVQFHRYPNVSPQQTYIKRDVLSNKLCLHSDTVSEIVTYSLNCLQSELVSYLKT
jgi:hypothetical protein